jgi:hypothetical protein
MNFPVYQEEGKYETEWNFSRRGYVSYYAKCIDPSYIVGPGAKRRAMRRVV